MRKPIDRRSILRAGSAAVAITVLPLPARAQSRLISDDMTETFERLFGGRDITPSGVTLTLPPIAENGYSVPLSVSVDSAMTADDYIKRITVLSERNPVALIAEFTLGPASGKAEIATRVRLGGSQTLMAVAETSGGRLYSGRAKAVVTLAACVVL